VGHNRPMAIRTPHVQDHLERLRPARDPVLAEMEELAVRDGVPVVEWETGRLLATLVAAMAPRRVLEVGTAIGVSTLHMARALPPDGRIVTLERDPGRIAQARGFWSRAGVADRIDLVEGDALASLERLDGPFDLVFLDATKTEVEAYLERLQGRLAERCLLVVDNLLMGGFVALPDGQETHWSPENLAAARAATRRLMESEEWVFSLLPVGDGVGLGARRPRRR
jgi:caffeoyl-CoA O-methyltransferase